MIFCDLVKLLLLIDVIDDDEAILMTSMMLTWLLILVIAIEIDRWWWYWPSDRRWPMMMKAWYHYWWWDVWYRWKWWAVDLLVMTRGQWWMKSSLWCWKKENDCGRADLLVLTYWWNAESIELMTYVCEEAIQSDIVPAITGDDIDEWPSVTVMSIAQLLKARPGDWEGLYLLLMTCLCCYWRLLTIVIDDIVEGLVTVFLQWVFITLLLWLSGGPWLWKAVWPDGP